VEVTVTESGGTTSATITDTLGENNFINSYNSDITPTGVETITLALVVLMTFAFSALILIADMHINRRKTILADTEGRGG
jgi:hypothetical protein